MNLSWRPMSTPPTVKDFTTTQAVELISATQNPIIRATFQAHFGGNPSTIWTHWRVVTLPPPPSPIQTLQDLEFAAYSKWHDNPCNSGAGTGPAFFAGADWGRSLQPRDPMFEQLQKTCDSLNEQVRRQADTISSLTLAVARAEGAIVKIGGIVRDA